MSWAGEDAVTGLTAYEALQPPLYYWIMAPFLRIAKGANLGTQVLLLRWLSIAIASITIPLVFLTARAVFRSDPIALGCAAVVAVMPEFAFDVARVGNECAAVVLFTLLTWLIVKSFSGDLFPIRALSIGIVLGLGLLTKAYFLTAIPPIAFLVGYRLWCGERRRALIAVVMIASSSLSIAAWWYLRNISTTGTLSGLSEATMLHGRMNELSVFQHAAEIKWPAVIDVILTSHLWFGGWSSLGIRAWMYHLFFAIIAVAAIGVMRLIRKPAILALIAIYGAFWAGQCYNALLLFVSKGMATSMGWYMYAVVGAEVTLCVAGLRAVLPPRYRRYVLAIGILLFVLLDFYTVHAIAIPYYTGIIAHRSNGALSSLHFADINKVGISEIVDRLTAYKKGALSRSALLVLWAAYLIATAALVLIGFTCGRAPKVDVRDS